MNISQRFYDRRKEHGQKDKRPPYRRPIRHGPGWRTRMWRIAKEVFEAALEANVSRNPYIRGARQFQRHWELNEAIWMDPSKDLGRPTTEWFRGQFAEAYDWLISGQWAKLGEDTAPRFEFRPANMDGWQPCENNVSISGSECGVHMQALAGSVCHLIPIGGQAMGGGTRFNNDGSISSGDGMIPAGTRYVIAGTVQNFFAPCNRYRAEALYSRPEPLTQPQPFGLRIPGRFVRLPVPTATPPLPIQFETYTPPAGSNRPPPLKPYEEPMIEAIVDPGGGINMRGGAHIRMPPGKNTREKKGKASGSAALALIGALYDGATEAAEIVDILYDNTAVSLPWRPGNPYSMSEKANFVWRNLDKLNIQGSIMDIVANHYEDKVWGRIFGTVGKHTPYGSMGPSHGGWGADVGKLKPL